jgi:hypothetical protein
MPNGFLLGKGDVMPSIGFVAPLLPGKTEVDRSAVISCWRGERRDAYQASRRRLGITREAIFIQPTPNGDVAVVYWEAADLDVAFKGMATSDDPFDRWYRDHIRDVHGMNVEDGFPPPEQVMDYRAGTPRAAPSRVPPPESGKR